MNNTKKLKENKSEEIKVEVEETVATTEEIIDVTAAEAAAASDELAAAIDEGDYLLKVEHLKKYFPLETDFFGKPKTYVRAVDDVTFGVKAGSTVGIVGESGCGKSISSMSLMRLIQAPAGQIVSGSIRFRSNVR